MNTKHYSNYRGGEGGIDVQMTELEVQSGKND